MCTERFSLYIFASQNFNVLSCNYDGICTEPNVFRDISEASLTEKGHLSRFRDPIPGPHPNLKVGENCGDRRVLQPVGGRDSHSREQKRNFFPNVTVLISFSVELALLQSGTVGWAEGVGG